MSSHLPHPPSVEVRLDINRARIGAYRAMRVFQACRAFAHSINPACHIEAIYEDYERTGWRFAMPNRIAALRLRTFHERVMQAPWP